MGKKKLNEMKLIRDLPARNVTYCKRKKGLIKKAMEISILCAQDLFLILYDQKK